MLIKSSNKPKPSIRERVTQLVSNPVRSAARKKAIITIAKRRNIPLADAKFQQAISIAKSQNRK